MDPCPHAPTAPREATSPQRCGANWYDADNKCGVECPKGIDGECPDGEYCFRDVTPCSTVEYLLAIQDLLVNVTGDLYDFVANANAEKEDVYGWRNLCIVSFNFTDVEEREPEEIIADVDTHLEELLIARCLSNGQDDDDYYFSEDDCRSIHVDYTVVDLTEDSAEVMYIVESSATTLAFGLLLCLVTMLAWF
eukprot:TRINITY_DN25_c0_g1_i2.p1 TRINITY_DN25_c0_g1~~TRINITY_DN25_c0_g1_i2.p1  ORF type:complete len:193 (-),score=43.67 TRINITY_DN25_c0_g1_i2:62-640(-)